MDRNKEPSPSPVSAYDSGPTQDTVMSSEKVSEDDGTLPSGESVYFFEGDHLALRGNNEYQSLLKTIVLLEAQRTQAIKDLEKLVECEETALVNPIAFVAKLQHNPVDLNLPKGQQIAELPVIDWERYTSNVDPNALGHHRHSTRRGARGSLEDTLNSLTSDPYSRPSTPNLPGTSNASNVSSNDATPTVIRGRVKNEHKPQTFNQLWNAEEQSRLEELLVSFPPEAVEARRWDKIAAALGNRTAQQVASRVQKYFIKLAKAGLPIPGRMPNMNAYLKRANAHRHQRFNRFYFQPSTFLQSYEPPVYMSDDEEDSSWGGSNMETDQGPVNSEVEISDEEDINPELRGTPQYAELMYLKNVKQQRLQINGNVEHIGFKCDRCDCEPIVGTRWHCMDCPVEDSVDFCDECMDCQYEGGSHNSSHRLDPVQPPGRANPHMDSDYTRFMPGDYSYLDPNFMPAT